MNLKNGSTAIFVKDIEISKDFYTSLLGLTISLDFGKNVIYNAGFTIWEIQKDHIITATLGIDMINNNTNNRFELYFETENLHEIHKVLKERNIKFLHELHEEPWGQNTIRFFDPDNHLIEIGESMNQFVSRFNKQGLSTKEISQRTSIPEDEVKKILNKE